MRGVSCELSRFQFRQATFQGTDAAKSRMVSIVCSPVRRGTPTGIPRKPSPLSDEVNHDQPAG